MRKFYYYIFLLVVGYLFANGANAQPLYKIKGTVYDSSRSYPLEAVSVLSTSGRGAVTNADGIYIIDVTENDSIWFSYLGKPTMRFPVLKIVNPSNFDISLQVNVTVLKEVKIRQKNYKLDSLQNREDYAKIFNYHKPGISTVTPSYGQAAGFDLDELINVFRFKRNRNLASFQKRLVLEEQEKFVDHRFNKGLVRRLTQLDGDALDSFMIVYRPSYAFTQLTSEYDFQQYIKRAAERFKKGLPPQAFLKPEEQDQ